MVPYFEKRCQWAMAGYVSALIKHVHFKELSGLVSFFFLPAFAQVACHAAAAEMNSVFV